MKQVNGWWIPDGSTEFLIDRLKPEKALHHGNLVMAMSHIPEEQRRTAIDCGAHVGTWSKLLAFMFETVVSFEPAPDTYACLKRNIGRQKNVILHQCAVGDVAKNVSMNLTEEKEFVGNLARQVQDGGDIRCVTIDEFNYQNVDFIKLDVEGYEMQALKGAKDTLKRCKPTLLVEHKNNGVRYGYGRKDLMKYIESIGYECVAGQKGDRIWKPKA